MPDTRITNLADTKVQCRFSFSQDRIMLNAGLNIPTGKTKMKGDELEVARLFIDEVFGFPCRRFGEGLDVNLGGVAVFPSGSWIIGGGYGFLVKGKYTPSPSFGAYQPGNETATTGIADVQWSSNLIRSSVTYKTFFKDRLEGRDFFQKGTQLIWTENIALQLGRTAFNGMVVNVFRGKNYRLRGTALAEEPHKSSGSDFRLHLELNHPVSQSLTASLFFERKMLGANQYPETDLSFQDESEATGIGIGLAFLAGKDALWQNRVYLRSGRTRFGGVQYDLAGLELFTGIKTSL
jgi:hypothetical protein